MSAIVAAASANLSDRSAHWVSDATGHSALAGPDEQTVRIGPRCGLGHALLRITAGDPSQPLTRDGRVWLTADVRLDDRARLIQALRTHGDSRADHGQSDPELLLAAYRIWGEAFLGHLTGDFAFVLWDDDRGTMLCGRDQIGVVPLHYAQVDGELLVATGVEPLLLHAGVADDLNEEALADFLVRTGEDFGSTAFQAVRRVPPAHVLRWTARDGTTRLRRYWRAPEWGPLVRFQEPEQYASRFGELLQAAVADRLGAERVSVHLSGGMDSTSVAALAHRILTQRGSAADSLRATTIVLGGDSGDREGEYAGLVSDALRIEVNLVDVSNREPLDPFAQPQPSTPEPTPYRWFTGDYEAACLSAGHARVCLTGLGADPLLAFVPWYWAEWLARGHPLRLSRALADYVLQFGDRPHPHLKRCLTHSLMSSTRPNPRPPKWLPNDFAQRTGIQHRIRPRSVTRGALLDVRSLVRDPSWSNMFMWSDPTFTRLPLRVWHPFVDLRLADFIARLPPYPWLVNKRVLREAMSGIVPEGVRRRPKTPLVCPPSALVGGAAQRRLIEFIGTAPGADRFIDRVALSEVLMASALPGAQFNDLELAQPLGLVYWHAHWRRPRSTGGTKVAAHAMKESGEEYS